MQSSNFLLLLFAALMILHRCDARRSTIDGSSKLVDNGETLVSAGENFEMGFFSDDDGLNKYVGIWYYKLSPRTVVWVANWNNSIQGKRIMNEDNSVVVEDGNLKVISNGYTYFSTKLGSGSNRKVELLDTGNLVLVDESGVEMWQSFRNLTDTFLPGMKMDSSLNWIDSKNGNYRFQLDQSSDKEYVIILPKQGKILWKGSAKLGKLSFGEMPDYVAYMLSNFTNKDVVDNSLESIGTFNKSRLLMNSSGEIQFYGWDKEISGWSLMWSAPKDTCDLYKYCGKFSICNSKREEVCKCLPGYKPNPPDNSKAGDFSGGCSRKSVSSCNEDNVEVLDTFLDLRSMKFKSPDKIISNISTREDCRRFCLGNCKCQAYTYDDSVCWIWDTSLMSLQENYAGGFNISVRVSISDIEATRRNCKPCGINLIPYPLSSGQNCGDPLYYSFSCDDLAGQVSFHTSNGKYTVVNFDKDNKTFVIEAAHKESVGTCDDKGPVTGISWFNQSSPFKVINWCYNPDENLTSGPFSRGKDLILISWKPPLEPFCKTSEDCNDWPNSSCNMTKQGERRCICQTDYKWNGLILNCSTSLELGTQGSFIAKLASSRNQRTLVISISVVLGVITLCSISYIIYQNTRVTRSREARDIVLGNHMEHFPRRESFGEDLITADEKRRIDVPFFSLYSILVATDNFSNAAKLGQGGFGPVYKGKFLEGAELAVKRLSNHSGQGVEEFKTEVMLIAKLQHRNLVRLLGYCVEGNEKILLYEYMANKSLDTFIFDHTFCRLLDWRIRFEIILGIARGLLYLHQDSRLRIIHRDLKTSNILLDDEMNAKISDFGLARIIEGKNTEVNTTRVVGTYGYMSPEYALEGLFSIKSDIFAFGVVVLEIISGKRNMEFFEEVNLTGYAWRLWMEDRALDMIDQTIVDTFEDKEVIKCVNVALLCVQEDPGDRPTMSNVVVMLGGESMTLPRPSQPHFITRRNALSTSSSSSKLYSTFNKELTITHEEEGQHIEM
ncbi:G-type lectin S-receptor-like serine/threonine-protein kinase At4g03230 isoform X2 [Solanum stenotomum]|uniref:G-type lectin S-receptor-like serine/threonine-protein kinase At4g03230 isoform X2 n=1 Tax=Solanum stenotomum TaxID=172797 RepID=UPI0020D15831|nr:G-type lectin S-receptor-like serine/threonine-protein kinase At4g03230 isoform X2 [Solanum stenotomum]